MNKPLIQEYENEAKLLNTVKELETRGVSQEHIYVLAHDKGRTEVVANKSDAKTIGIKEEGLGTAIKNVFESTGDKLRNKLEEMGLSKLEANAYEEKLDQGKLLLIINNDKKVALGVMKYL